MSVFSDNLIILLQTTNTSQRKLAQELGIPTSSVSRYCSGEQMPRMEVIEDIAEYFRVKVSELFSEDMADSFAPPKDKRLHTFNQTQHEVDCRAKIAEVLAEILDLSETEADDVLQYLQFLKSKRKFPIKKEDNTHENN